jgi:hypothetical protein
MRLRQIAFVAEKLAPIAEELTDIFGLEVGFRDPGVGHFGLENVVVPINGNFLEVVAPIQENTSAGRYLERRQGDGGYMVILQTDDAIKYRERFNKMGVRDVFRIDRPEYTDTHFHPRDVGTILLSIASVEAEGDFREKMCAWDPGGPKWKDHLSTHLANDLTGVEIQTDDPLALGEQWSGLLDIPLQRSAEGFEIPLTEGVIRFVSVTDGRGPGVGAIDITTNNKAEILMRAGARGRKLSDDCVQVSGCRVNLI